MRLKTLLYTLCILILLLLQSTLLNYAKIYDIKPNLLIVFVICVALLRGYIEGGVVGFFVGLSLDMLFGKFLGFYALLGLYLGIAVGSVNRRLYRENFIVVILFTFIATIVFEALVYILSSFMNGNMDLLFPMTRVILPEALYNSGVSIIIYAMVIKMDYSFEESSKTARKY